MSCVDYVPNVTLTRITSVKCTCKVSQRQNAKKEYIRIELFHIFNVINYLIFQ